LINTQARNLREKLEFRCTPMLNPDGVANGNYRYYLTQSV